MPLNWSKEDMEAATRKASANRNKLSQSGLSKELHPLLRNLGSQMQSQLASAKPKPGRGNRFAANFFNPYLNQASGPDQPTPRKRRRFELNEPGKWLAKADDIREKLEQRKVDEALLEKKKAKGLLPNTLAGEDRALKPTPPPWIEWWDRPYLSGPNYLYTDAPGPNGEKNAFVLDSEEAPITQYIHHPVLLPPAWENPVEAKVYLTAQERKRQRKLTREARNKLKQDRIRLGLDPAPPPKVRLANLMNVLKNEAITDPTAIEAKVRKEVEERLQKHLADNAARKLTKEQKAEKIHAQRERDVAEGAWCGVYRVDGLTSPKHIFKIDMNAKQQELVGMAVLATPFSLVVVQGGAKMARWYDNLMMLRIQWSGEEKCQRVWLGEVSARTFKRWSVERPQDENEISELLTRFGIANYWQQALTI